ncbi:TetR/AcrR family transcriptional regulator [Nocardioides panacisoli]|uniref:TetR/AcrR family transcriptional regulator n=1 Tax=Nocardioides panacisoli TaxID=627624 RepID=UPI001C638828|nr:TetR/AcrR family transcriptional regulator [Nocardioides panacisoli]QYJ02733.1 TetR/AcrR family transcriptional regulator [Nocardioides panacisoli]
MPKVTEEHRAARREQIVRAMLRCVAQDGFHRTTMAAVIRESGLSAGAVYLYFRNKQDLIRAIAETAIADVAVVVEEAAEAEELPDPERVVLDLTQRIVDLGEAHGVELHRVALQTWAEAVRDPEVLEIARGEAGRIAAAWVTYARRAIEAGFLPADAEPTRVARALMGLLPGFMLQRLVFPDVTPAAYAAGLGDLLRH